MIDKKYHPNRLKNQTCDSLEFAEVLGFFAQQAQTNMGKARVLALNLLPEHMQKAHFEMLSLWCDWLAVGNELRFPVILDPGDFNRQTRVNPFGAKALRDIRDMLSFWYELTLREALALMLPSSETPAPLKDLTKKLARLFEPNGSWRDDVSPTYTRLIQDLRKTQGRIDQTFRQLLQNHRSILSEAVPFTRNNRRVLAVKKDFQGKVRGILQDYSASGHTVFIEPEAIIQIQNRLHQLDFEIKEELFRIRCELTAAILAHPFIWEVLCPHLAKMDMLQALGITAKDTGCHPICPNDQGHLNLRNARHPFLDQAFAVHRQKERGLEAADHNQMIAFYLNLDDSMRGLIISGANAGGKTVALKTTGLLAWMANAGLPVAVDEGSEIPFYSHICADIGDHQSLSHNLSTYASHLETMKHILNLPAGRKLILLDELGSGTDPQEGNALAQAMIESLVTQPNHLLVTTHQQILCTLALNHTHLDNGSMIFDRRLLRPTYRFQQGVPGRSHALDIAANTGLPTTILERALGLIDTQQIDVKAAIHQLQEKNRELDRQKSKFRKEERRLVRRIADTRKETQALKSERETLREKAQLRLKKAVDAAEKELRQVLRNANHRKQARRSFSEFQAVRKTILPDTPEKLADSTVAASAKPVEQWQTGDRVFLPSWRTQGQLISHDRKRALINCNGKQLHATVADVLHLDDQNPPTPIVSDNLDVDSDQPVTFELNLLGFRVEEAVLEIDKHLDLAMRKQSPFLRIIHGHGTGALKTGVRSFLKSHPARTSFQLNISPENDGITDIQFTA